MAKRSYALDYSITAFYCTHVTTPICVHFSLWYCVLVLLLSGILDATGSYVDFCFLYARHQESARERCYKMTCCNQ
jgi:uncharacterized membrane protein YhfC